MDSSVRWKDGPQPRRWPSWLRWSTVAVLVSLLVLDLAFPPPLPKIRDTSTLVVARDGTPLRAFADRDGVWRYPASPDTVSPLYLQALLNYEDRWFWKHPGINPWALMRAAGQFVRHGRVVSGGSTLTMQVARMLDRHSRTPWGKVKQMLRAMQLEAHLSKREILTLYLERAPFGGTIEGVDAASWAYLGKPASRLSHAEAALLAVLPQSPSRLRPDRHPDAARVARDKVLQRMVDLGVWSNAQVDDARIEPVVARRLQAPLSAALLAERLRRQQPRAPRITSTLDAGLQRTLEERSGLLLLLARTHVRGTAGGRQRHDGGAGVRRLGGVRRSRTAGACGHGAGLAFARLDAEAVPVRAGARRWADPFRKPAGRCAAVVRQYRPGNFDAAFNGPVSAADALRLSLNVPAVDLLDRVGPARFSARLANNGLTLRYPRGAQPNLSLILGGTGARLEDLVGAYAALNRGGLSGRVRYTAQDPSSDRRLLSPGAAWIIREILEAHPRPGYGGGVLDTGSRPRVAWKTGTSYGFRDAWALGATRRYTVGVWVGRPDGTPLPGQYGAVTALPLMFEVIDSLPRGQGDAGPTPPPAEVAEHAICWPLGTQAEAEAPQLCQRRRDAWTLGGNVPPTFAERDARLWSAGRERFEVDARTGLRLSGECARPHDVRSTEIARWPALASPWLPARERAASRLPRLSPDCQPDGRDAVEELRIEGLNDLATLARAPGSEHGVRLQLRALGTDARVQWLLDGRWIAETRGAQAFQQDFTETGTHQLTALADSGAWTRVRFNVLR